MLGIAQRRDAVDLSAHLTVSGVGAGQAALLAAFEHTDHVVIDIAKKAHADVSGIQLIEAARHYAAANGKQVSIAAPANGHLLDVLTSGGFVEAKAREARQFWLHEGSAT